ncbi:MAG: hypothetical protein KUG72_09125 [Pseudomonadales bacterium]|nr:hypothetical protein [Pseudomonadales bacterium]
MTLVRTNRVWGFITRRHIRQPDGTTKTYHSRHHRKRLHSQSVSIPNVDKKGFWRSAQLNDLIGIVFAIGAALFACGSILFLCPDLAAFWSLSANQINGIFFAGSIPFSTAAWLQLAQAANSGDFTDAGGVTQNGFKPFGWFPDNIGWLSCMLQFFGTLLFNINTFDALSPDLNWFQQDLAIWIPNLFGSLLFLASGYLAFIEICHGHWAWRPRALEWRITFINLLGCIAFLISSLFAFILPRGSAIGDTASLIFTVLGAIAFFIGALLLIPESSKSRSVDPVPEGSQ